METEEISIFSTKRKSEKSVIKQSPVQEKQNAEIEHKPVHSFKELGLDLWLVEMLSSLNIHTPTMVQSMCIPAILQGKNVIGSAKTGQGKTAAFALPMLQQLSKDPFGVFAIVLTPARELALQIAEQFKVFGRGISLKVSVIIGGLDLIEQAISLTKRPHIIIATPGRLCDILKTSGDDVNLGKLKYLVIDEADRLLEDCFADDLSFIISKLPKERQTLLFSATMTSEIEKLNALHSKVKPMYVFRDNEKYDTVEKLNQQYLFIPSKVKDAYLHYLLQNDFKDATVIIFTGKCKTCELLSNSLKELGHRVTSLHSQMSQQERINSIAKFKGEIIKILITTDVGSRGLDIPSVKLVINYDLPLDPTDYIHRIGRTARAGRGGIALSFVCELDVQVLKNIEEKIKKELVEYTVEEKNILPLVVKVLSAKRVASIKLIESDFEEKYKRRRRK